MFSAAFRDRAVYLPAGDAVVLADVHLGRGEASDVEVPLEAATRLDERLCALLERYEPGRVVFAGDVLHQYSRVSDRVARSFDALTDACREFGAKPVLVAGNHDAQLSRVWSGEIHDAVRIELDRPTDANGASDASERTDANDASDASGVGELDEAVVPDGEYAPRIAGPVIVRHGHERPPEEETRTAGTYLIGHDHPTVEIEGRRRPCYLAVPSGPGDTPTIQLPAFNRLPAGVTIDGMVGSDFQTPFVRNADDCRPIVWDDDASRVLTFPPLGEFRRML